jgi:pentose-5-phosphate-3-epimerase
MIKICPAILTSGERSLVDLLDLLTPIFKHIDIDLNVENDNFDGKVTVDLERVIESISSYSNKFTLHLMVSDPSDFVRQVEQSELPRDRINLMLHQESHAENYLNREFKVGVAVKAETELKSIEYYNQFPEIQLMTIETGVQGNPLKPETLDRVEELREMGFEGTISLDGSVNLKTAQLIKLHDVDRVSVGSYFTRADDVIDALEKLNKELNG